MGFYGNITNTSKTQFQFDKIYSSRRVMEESMNGDGVFVGRYVLVEYDSDVTNVYKQQLYRKDDDYYDTNSQLYYLYLDANLEQKVQYRNSTENDTSINYGIYGDEAYKGAIAYVIEPSQSTTYYQCVGSNGGYAVFQVIDTNSNYVFNYSQDKDWAQEKGYADIGRGWDSTVWQKVYSNGIERYVMIAELNSVVPTFDISADAPSISPMTPHFDENSNNMYYKLHWQPQWGVRVKAAYSDLKGDVLEDSGAVDINESNIYLRSIDDQVSYPSDINVNWDKFEYDKSIDDVYHYSFGLLDDNSHNGTWVDVKDQSSENSPNIIKAQKGIPGAIYFNKDGLDVAKIAKSSDLFSERYRPEKFNYVSSLDNWPNKKFEDEIRLVPTGLSGHKYNQHHGVYDKRPDVDTYELSMMLPSLGDTISDIWDLIYGGRSIDSIEETGERNMDIRWEDASQGQSKEGLRLVRLKDNGELSYTVSEINTLAGCINSAHDIMGMIVQDTRLGNNISFSDQTTLNNLSSDNIYYYGGAYYRKRKFYDYNAPISGESLKNYEQIELTPFATNTYYDKVVSNYLLLTTAPEDNHTVYTISGVPEKVSETGQFSQTYAANRYYYRTKAYGAGATGEYAHYYDYTLETSPIQDNTREYVSLFNYDSDGVYHAVYDNGELISEPIMHRYYFYRPGVYYYFPSEDNGGTANPDETPVPDNGLTIDSEETQRIYYVRTVVRERNIVTNEWIETYKFTKLSSDELVEFEENKFYEYDNNSNTYDLLKSAPTNLESGKFVAKECFTLPWPEHNPGSVYFYQAGLYYYISNNNYLLDTNETYTNNRVYYKVPAAVAHPNITFYKPGVYYVTDTSATEPASNATPTGAAYDNSKFYWKKADWYVSSDSNNIYAAGMKWDKTVAVPTGVTLCNRTERWGVEELEGFATNLNTMLGLILKIKAKLDEGNSDTRDTQTVQGCINLMNDIIAKFGERKVGDVMITNNYGQIAGASQTSAQPYQYINVGTNTTSAATSSLEDQWIYWNVESNYFNPSPKITLKHTLVSEKSHQITDTLTKANKNNNTAVGQDEVAGLNFGQGDMIKLHTPIIDIAGHVVGQNVEEVILPYGFKTIAVGAQSTATSQLSTNTTSAIADNTQDTLTLNTGNKWIRLAGTSGANAAITIAHETHDVTPTASTGSLAGRTSASVSFEVPSYAFDNAGHYNGSDVKTYTLTIPYVFKTIKVTNSDETSEAASSVNSSGQIAELVEDTLTFSASNKWVKLDNNTDDTVKIGHVLSGVTANSYGDSGNQVPNFGSTFNVPYITVDAAGHITGLSAHTVKIPNGSLTDAAANGADVITQLSFTASSGALSTTRANIGSLLLTGYQIASSTGSVESSDTLNSALGKLQYQINSSISALTTLNGNDSTEGSVAHSIKTVINGLDATQTQSAAAGNGQLALSITETDGKITAISGSIASNTYDAYGAASSAASGVVGTSGDSSSATTVYGAKAYADSLVEGYRVPSCTKTSAGTYVLECTVTGSGTTAAYEYNWVAKT